MIDKKWNLHVFPLIILVDIVVMIGASVRYVSICWCECDDNTMFIRHQAIN